MSSPGELLVILQLGSCEPRPGSVLLTRKALSGLERHAALWRGDVRVVLPPGGTSTGNLDDVVVERARLPFACDILPLDGAVVRERARNAAAVLGVPDHRLLGMAAFCRAQRVAYVVTTEYSLRTRSQIALVDAKGPARKLRRLSWECRQELAFRAEVRAAAGIQCNGTPTHDAYAPIARSALLFFDSRISPAMVASPDVVRARAARRTGRGPIRLAFSGRLHAIKGADALPAVAAALRARGVDFLLDVCGSGPEEPRMREEVRRLGLSERVRFRGVLDFERELIPFMRDEIDLFVCCHRQGDPSCTYLETLATGVPIAGWANEALVGLLRRVPAGWTARMGSVNALADVVAGLARAPAALGDAGLAAVRFAAEHTFDETFARRGAHLEAALDAVRGAPAAARTA